MGLEVEVDCEGACGLAPYRDFGRVAAEGGCVLLDPFEGFVLVV